jgi:STE24 endopeptidase
MNSTTLFSCIFLCALLLSSGMRAWLALRQYRHVAAHRAAVPAEFATSIPLADHQKAADYTQARLRVAFIELATDASLLLLLTFGGLFAALDQAWFSVFATRGEAYGLALFASIGVISFLVDLPFTLYRTFVLEARFGFNKMTWRTFLADLGKQMALVMVIGAPLLWVVLWLMAAMGDHWWWYVWLFWLAFNLLVMPLYPTLIAPLFNRFSPLPDGELKTRITGLLARCNFTVSGLFIMDGSRRSAHGNAYFTGLGRAKRIVFFDTLLDKLQPAAAEAVLAHELGHFKHRHVWQRIALMAAIGFALLWVLGQFIHELWFYQGLGVAAPSTAMALLLFSQVLPVFLFPLTPLAALLSRRQEYEADDYASRYASAADLVTALVCLYRDNAATLTPDPLHSLFYDSHPPASLRIARLRGG